jgi:hypothetical protein
MHQFDVPKKKWNEASNDLMDLAGDFEEEEMLTQVEFEGSQDLEDDSPTRDNNEGWVDERDDMAEEELEDLEESVQPIRFLLTKVGEHASAVQY